MSILGRVTLEIKTLVETLKFNQGVNRSGFATVGNYYVTFFPGTYAFSVVPYFTFNLSEPPSVSLITALNKVLEPFKVIVDQENTTLILIFNEPISSVKDKSIEAIHSILTKTTNVLKELAILQPQNCIDCQAEGYDTYIFEHGVHLPIHKVCLEKRLESHKPPSNIASAIDPLAYMKSMVLSVFFALLFTIPSILSAIYSPLFYVLLLLLVPLGSALGYLIGKGVVIKQTYQFMRLTSYLTGIIIVIWCWNFYAKVHSQPFFYYLFELDNLIPFFFDLVVGTLLITFGLLLAKKILPIRKL